MHMRVRAYSNSVQYTVLGITLRITNITNISLFHRAF